MGKCIGVLHWPENVLLHFAGGKIWRVVQMHARQFSAFNREAGHHSRALFGQISMDQNHRQRRSVEKGVVSFSHGFPASRL